MSDTFRLGSRVTVNAGLAFRPQPRHQPGHAPARREGDETGETIVGLARGTWNTVSPRLGVIATLDGAGRTLLRGSYGRFGQGC